MGTDFVSGGWDRTVSTEDMDGKGGPLGGPVKPPTQSVYDSDS